MSAKRTSEELKVLVRFARLSGSSGMNGHVGVSNERLAYSVRKSLTRVKARAR